MLDTFSYIVAVFIINQCNMVTKFKNYLAKTNLAKNTITSYVWTVQYFLNHYEDVNKKEPFGLQRVFSGKLQTADCQSPIARYQQVS